MADEGMVERLVRQTSGNDTRIAEAIRVLEGGPQRQDSTAEQMQDVMVLALAAGCYDAHDRLKRHFDSA